MAETRNSPDAVPKTAHEKALQAVHSGRVLKRDGFCEVPTSLFSDKIDPTMPRLPAIDFFLFEDADFTPMVPPGQTISFAQLASQPTVWVNESEFENVRKYAEAMIRRQIADPALSQEDKLRALKNSALLVVEDLFEKPTQENIQRSMKVVGSFVYVLMKDPKSYLHLNQLSDHDPYTLRHSVGTAVNSIILAKKLGITDEKELIDVGMAGLLHDIGKVKVRREIINKDGPLDELEWEEMRNHAQAGYEIIKNDPNLSERTKRAVWEHHEEQNGTGYPQGLKHSETDLFSRIVCICDVFNALTTDRTYSKARTPFDAFQLMRDKISHKIDNGLFQELVKIYGGQIL
jgi:putative nucleotidyltransferase with HDIG domain